MVGQELGAEPVHLGHRCALVTPIEVAEEVGSVPSVEGQQSGGLGQGLHREPHPVPRGEVPGCQPGVAEHHVAGDDRVLEIERRQVAFGSQDSGSKPAGPGVGIVSVNGSTLRFRVPSLAAGSYKLALDGSALPTVTSCVGAKSCELTLDASELAAVPVDLL